jgi:hypothetical protein
VKNFFRGFRDYHGFALTALALGLITRDQAWFAAAWVILYLGISK